MAATAPTEARELELVGKVELRIALAKDDKLESVLKVYLPPLLLKLASDHVEVRNKVISTCQHIKIRLGGNQSIVLPVASLLKQYKENANQTMIRHFDLLFIQQSIGKLSSAEQLDLLPVLLLGLANDAGKATCATVFNLFLRLLPRLRMPLRGSKEDTELPTRLGLDEHPEDADFVASWFGKLMLLSKISPPITPSQTMTGMVSSVVSESISNPGLSAEEYAFLTLNSKTGAWNPTSPEGLNLTETKITVLSFLASGAFTDAQRFVPALFAASDPNSRISDLGEDMLKRTSVSFEDKALVNDLFQVYTKSKPALQIRILAILTKSAVATSFPEKVLSVVQGMQPGDSTQIMQGLEATKFRNAVFNFINWVARMGSHNDLQQLAPPLVRFLKNYIEDQGWPVPHDRSSDQASLRALAYETLGSMAKTVPTIALEPELELVRWLFRSLTEEQSSDTIFISIDGALASLLNAFAAPLDPVIRDGLRSLLLFYMNQEEDEKVIRSARFAAVRWANQCLEYNDVVARWIDILAVGGRSDERSDVVEEGNKGLDPYWYRLINSSNTSSSFQLPDWSELVNVFFTGQSLMKNSRIANSMRSGIEVDSIPVFGNFPPSRINAYAHAVSYCRRMILLQSLESKEGDIGTDADWERQMDVLLRTDKISRQKIKAHLSKVDDTVLGTYLMAAFQGMKGNDGKGFLDCGKSFVEIGALAPSKALSNLAPEADNILLATIRSNDSATRYVGAQALGMLISHPSVDISRLIAMVKLLMKDTETWQSAVGSEVNRVHGSIIALGRLLSRAVFYGRTEVLQSELVEQAVLLVLGVLINAKDATTKEAALVAIGQLSISGLLTTGVLSRSSSSSLEIIKKLTEDAKKGNEKAITALGRFAMGFDEPVEESEDQPLPTILKSLYELHELRQAEIHFTIGEAIACASVGWKSDSLLLSLDVETRYNMPVERTTTLNQVMEKILADCKATKPSLKKASGIWLFSLIQYCGHLEEIQNRLRECQAAFMGLLSSRDDLVQETASRGLSLVYEQGDEGLKKQLVTDLVASFTGTSTKLKVDQETELFEPGALPTGDGESVTSYKDIVSLAAEVGDQSLVYKFMSLASNAATWSTRAAFGRFGLSSILSESAVDPKLYPKLYRYRFDPNPNVQRSMNDIWTALVKTPNQVIDEYFDAIMTDLLENILGKEWRTRQASCAAISDLVQGRQFEKYEKHISSIWEVAFKVLDDIKGSVRKAAESLCQVLTAILVRQLEQGTSSKNAQVMLKEVMPFLFSTRGLESPAKEVQKFAYDTVLKLVKNGGKTLLPFIPSLVEQILGLLSTLEPAEINYLHINAARYDTTEEKIDQIRSTMISQSPMMEAIEHCLDVADEPTMKALVPCLENVIKTAVGMPSKVGCSGVLVSLSTRHSFIFQPHANVFLKIIEKAVLDRNSTVSAAYARAAGYIARLASDQQLLKLASFSKSLYFSAEDEVRRQTSAEITYAISKFATDRFNSLAADFLPFVFMAKHDADGHVQENMKKTWDENVGGSRAVLLYLKEIVSLSSECLGSAKWTVKHTAALTIADTVNSAGTDISLSNAQILWPALEKALALKTFDGKEKVLDGFVKFTQNGKSLWEKDAAVAAQMKKIALREVNRNNEAYRPKAFLTLGEFAEARIDIDLFPEVYAIIGARLEELTDPDSMDTAEEDDTKTLISRDSLTINAGISTLFRSINTHLSNPSPISYLQTLLTLLPRLLASPKSTISTRMVMYKRMKAVFNKLLTRPAPDLEAGAGAAHGNEYSSLPLQFFNLLELQDAAGSEQARTQRAESAQALCEALSKDVFGGNVEGREEMTKVIGVTAMEERSAGVRAVLEKAAKVLG